MAKKKKERIRTRDELVKAFNYHKSKADESTLGYDYDYHSRKMTELLNAINDMDTKNEVI